MLSIPHLPALSLRVPRKEYLSQQGTLLTGGNHLPCSHLINPEGRLADRSRHLPGTVGPVLPTFTVQQPVSLLLLTALALTVQPLCS